MAGMADPKKKPFVADVNPMELVGDFGRHVADQLNIIPRSEGFSGELKPGQTLELQAQKAEKKIENLQRQLNNVKTSEKMVFSQESEATRRKMEELVLAIHREVISVKSQAAALTGQVENITVEQINRKPGLYHLNFFEWVISMLKDLKKDIVKSRTWLSTFKSKKQKKGYWAMFKKHGTGFAMSDERSIATAAG